MTVEFLKRVTCTTNLRGDMNGILLGDNGYGLQPFLIVPFLTPQNQGEEYYNHVHKKARCTIERSFGQLKRRFFCLGSTVRIKLDRIPAVITACVYLHNMAKNLQDPTFLHSDTDDTDDATDHPSDCPSLVNAPEITGRQNDSYIRRMGEAKRQEIVNFLQIHKRN